MGRRRLGTRDRSSRPRRHQPGRIYETSEGLTHDQTITTAGRTRTSAARRSGARCPLRSRSTRWRLRLHLRSTALRGRQTATNGARWEQRERRLNRRGHRTATGEGQVSVLPALAAAADLAGGIANSVRIFNLTGYVASSVPAGGERFTSPPAVINGASELLGEVSAAAGPHARAAVGVAALPADAPVELDLIVKVS